MRRMRQLWQQATQWFQHDSAAWNLTVTQALVLAGAPVLIMLSLAATVPFFNLFVWITAEDSLLEWAQFAMLLLAGMGFARLGLGQFGRRQRRAAAVCLALAIGLVFIAGEEIAWAQRVLGFGTPPALKDVNVQQETTLHNIGSLHALFVYGVMFGGLAAALAPVAWQVVRRGQARPPLAYLFVPPLGLVTAFLMPFGYRFARLFLGLDERFPRLIFPITKFSEVTETCLYFGLLAFAWLNLRRFSAARGAAQPHAAPAEAPAQPAVRGRL